MFKESFKYYKSKNPPPNLDNVIDFNNLDQITEKLIRVNISNIEPLKNTSFLKPVRSWEVYELKNHPGLIFIKNPFTSFGQRYWVVRCLQDYSRRPNKTNLDAFNLLPENKHWWETCQNSNTLLVNKLRWVTFGYHHNWDTKIYNESNKSEFPKDLEDLTKYVAKVLNYNTYSPEAAIVNYYQMDSTLSGHTDYSEQNLQAPLISFSFGQTAIFLLGGKTKDEDPIAVLLRSGDVLVMSKDSRLCYHGVPKILQIDTRFWDNFDEKIDSNITETNTIKICKDEDDWRPFGEYLNHSRININVRQVLNKGQKRLFSETEENI